MPPDLRGLEGRLLPTRAVLLYINLLGSLNFFRTSPSRQRFCVELKAPGSISASHCRRRN